MENISNKILVIGITGCIGSGKSTVAKIISQFGYNVISSDENAKLLMNNNQKIKSKIKNELGTEYYTSDGIIDSNKIAEIIFGQNTKNKEFLEKLNKIVHPEVIEKMIDEIEVLYNQGEKVVFVESALMFETGLFEGFDYIVTVNATKDVLIKRTMERSNLTKEQVEARLKSQMSAEDKKKYADFVIENSKSITDLEQSINFLLPILVNLPPKELSDEEE